MRGIILVILSISITGAAALFILNKDMAFEGNEQGASIGGNNATVGGLPKTIPLSELSAVPADSIEVADKYLAEALPLTGPKDRFVLIDKINSFKEAYELALTESRSELMIRATARYIAAWSPFYYYIHQDARSVLGPIIKTLERNRADMLKELAKHDLPAGQAGARKAGELAAQDIEYYIEDIRKSAARRNSDFIAFSLQDYEKYREIFDELFDKYSDFRFGFAELAHILFDDFYRMHEEVDLGYLEKTRKKVEDARLLLRDLHKSTLVQFAQIDESAAKSALAKTISVIESELSAHPDWRVELHDIMKSDYEFYKGITL